MEQERIFPQQMEPLGEGTFDFDCHAGIECFTVCCRNVDMILYPYDVIRLKTRIGIDSEEFLRLYSRFVAGDNPFFPSLKLKLPNEGAGACPFLSEKGCTVYTHRPSACRTYPLERAVDRNTDRGAVREFYFLTHHPYCYGHRQPRKQTVKSWLRGQQLLEYNTYNDLWAEMDTLFATNPWKGEGAAGERQKLAFMVCYNIDGFRRFVDSRNLLAHFRLEKTQRRSIVGDDRELLKFGFEWLKLLLQGKSRLVKK